MVRRMSTGSKQKRRLPSQRRSQEVVLAIRTAAARVLASEGYERATTNRIAVEAGVGIGTLYQYFEDKDDVFRSLAQDLAQKAQEAVVTAFRTSGPDALRDMEPVATEFLGKHGRVLRALGQVPQVRLRERFIEPAAAVVAPVLLEAAGLPSWLIEPVHIRLVVSVAYPVVVSVPGDGVMETTAAMLHGFVGRLVAQTPGQKHGG